MGTLTLPTAGTLAGLTAVQDINAANSALATMSQGGTAPTPASTGLASTAGLLWHDTTNNLLKLRNQADTGWITVGSFDETNGGFIPYYEGSALPAVQRSYLAGLTLSNDGTSPNTVIDVSAGSCADSTNAALIELGAFTKSISGTWVAGSGNNGLDTGTVAASTWYNVFAISKANGAAPDVLFSLTTVPTALPTGYTLFRRLGAIRTDASAHILAFSQNGDEFLWAAAVTDVNTATLGTAAQIFTLTVPPGLKVNALFRALMTSATANVAVLLNSPDENSTGSDNPGGNASLFNAVANNAAAGHFNIRTNTSAQIRAVGGVASTTLQIATYGWIDVRGRFN